MSNVFFEKKPLLNFSESEERASFIDTESHSMPSRRKRVGVSKRRKVRVGKGRIKLRVAGFRGVQNLSPSALVKKIPISVLKRAAKKVLKNNGHNWRKSRKGRKRRMRKRK